MTMIISSYTSIHPFLGAYIIHSVYDKFISLQNQTLLHNNIQTYIRAKTLYMSIQWDSCEQLLIHIILKIDKNLKQKKSISNKQYKAIKN